MLTAILVPLLVLLARQRRIALAPVAAFALPILGPLAIVVWSGLFWGAAERHGSGGHWASRVLMALVIASLAVILGIAIRYRKAPRYWLVMTTAGANFIFALGAGLVGGMAISNSWL
jgi:hypothetical protein